MKIKNLLLVICAVVTSQIHAQLPTANIYHFEFRQLGDELNVSKMKFLTDFNRDGYNNQPYFFSDNEIYITSDFNAKQPDIWKLDLLREKITRVTKTTAGEFSPTLLPNKANFAVVRQEDNGDQWLWSYPIDQSNRGKNLIQEHNTVGYFHWFNSHKVAFFAVGDPHRLLLVNKLTEEEQIISSNIGRTLLEHDGMFYYVQKSSVGNSIVQYDFSTNKNRKIVALPDQVEDFTIAPNGNIYFGNGAKLYMANKQTKSHQEVADMTAYGIGKITRLKIRKNKMCLVDAL